MAYDFPGNVRELENIIERALALSQSEELGPEDLALHRIAPDDADAEAIEAHAASQPREGPLPAYLDKLEREAILQALGKTGFNRTAAARLLGITFRQLRYRMQRLGIREKTLRFVESPNCDDRPAGGEVSLVVLHSISLPPGEYGGDSIERLFTNRLDPAAHPYFRRDPRPESVGSHFLVRRDGEIVQFVPVERRAWHAGASSWRGRSRCNDFSIGIELEGAEEDVFTEAQYRALAVLLKDLRKNFPLRDVAAHSDVAPGRKTDPGPRFDWTRLLTELATS